MIVKKLGEEDEMILILIILGLIIGNLIFISNMLIEIKLLLNNIYHITNSKSK